MSWKQNPKIIKAFELARKAQDNAYAPYSKFQVGACFKTKSGEFFSGCNLENASIGATVCAERNALAELVKSTENRSIEFLVVVTPPDEPIPPCGICLQVLSEFLKADTPIYLGNKDGLAEKIYYKELMPRTFTSF